MVSTSFGCARQGTLTTRLWLAKFSRRNVLGCSAVKNVFVVDLRRPQAPCARDVSLNSVRASAVS
jgi:hypothetical protein